ncbi:MAG: PqqD family protein [Bacteroidales bacterium]|nr:PqqD family protein [Bacteroidales bacterium]
MDLKTKIKRNGNSSFQVADGKAVVMLAVNSNIFTLNEIGTIIWGLLNETKTYEELVSGVLSKFPDENQEAIQEDILAFVKDCLKEQLLLLEA